MCDLVRTPGMSSPIGRLGRSTWSADAEPAVVDVDGEDADAVLDALASETARELFRALHDEPAPPSELARRLDTSVQNAHYHVKNLEDAGVVEVAGSRYSDKGNEMSVYAPAVDPIVLLGDASAAERTALQGVVADWATGIATLALVSVAIQLAFDRLVGATGSGFFEPSALGTTGLPVGSAVATAIASPGVLFFVGGTAVLTLSVLLDYRE